MKEIKLEKDIAPLAPERLYRLRK